MFELQIMGCGSVKVKRAKKVPAPAKGSTTLSGGGFLREKMRVFCVKSEHVYQIREHVQQSQRFRMAS
jgi:hypothetical protein